MRERYIFTEGDYAPKESLRNSVIMPPTIVEDEPSEDLESWLPAMRGLSAAKVSELGDEARDYMNRTGRFAADEPASVEAATGVSASRASASSATVEAGTTGADAALGTLADPVSAERSDADRASTSSAGDRATSSAGETAAGSAGNVSIGNADATATGSERDVSSASTNDPLSSEHHLLIPGLDDMPDGAIVEHGIIFPIDPDELVVPGAAAEQGELIIPGAAAEQGELVITPRQLDPSTPDPIATPAGAAAHQAAHQADQIAAANQHANHQADPYADQQADAYHDPNAMGHDMPDNGELDTGVPYGQADGSTVDALGFGQSFGFVPNHQDAQFSRENEDPHYDPGYKRSIRGRVITALTVVTILAVLAVVPMVLIPTDMTVAGVPIHTLEDAQANLGTVEAHINELSFNVMSDKNDSAVLAGKDLHIAVIPESTLEPITTWQGRSRVWINRMFGVKHLPLFISVGNMTEITNVAKTLSKEPVNPEATFTDTAVQFTPGANGYEVTPKEISDAIRDAVQESSSTGDALPTTPLVAQVTTKEILPAITAKDTAAVEAKVNLLLGSHITLAAPERPVEAKADGKEESKPEAKADEKKEGDGKKAKNKPKKPLKGPDGGGISHAKRPDDYAVTKADYLKFLAVDVQSGNPEGERFQLHANPESLTPALQAFFAAVAVPGKAEVHVDNLSPAPAKTDPVNKVLHDPSTVKGTLVVDSIAGGFLPDVQKTLDEVIAKGQGGEATSRVVVSGFQEPPKSLQGLGIVEPISTYTTFFAPSGGRVTNIKRIADMVDGYIIAPGQSFELNHYIGRRTADKGFVAGGALESGHAVSVLGGGISQFATTIYNAAYFAGLDIPHYKAHSQWFARYPAGREATLNYPTINLEMVNNTPYSILIDTSYTKTSVTVTFWSTKYWDVTAERGKCACRPGAAFTVGWARTRTNPDGHKDVWKTSTIYRSPPATPKEDH